MQIVSDRFFLMAPCAASFMRQIHAMETFTDTVENLVHRDYP
jgi:hypothetical protein